MVGVRTLVDTRDPDDVAAVAAIQDGIGLAAGSARAYGAPAVDATSLDATRAALLQLAAGMTGFARAFGRGDAVDPIVHLIGTAAGWGGLPDAEATYQGVSPGLPPGTYELTVGDVPVDAFWSLSVYDAEGYFVPNDRDAYSVNSVTGVRDDDGSITIRFGDHPEGAHNVIPTPEGWNYLVRLYRPRPEILDGSWTFPALPPQLV